MKLSVKSKTNALVLLLPALSLQLGCGETRAVDVARAQKACARIGEINNATFKGVRPIKDEAFDELLGVLDGARPCVIEKIGDTTPASFTSPHENLKTGDLALFFLEAADGINWVALLPLETQTDIRARGIAAYFSFVKDAKNRTRLRDRVQKHYQDGFKPNPKKRKELMALRKWNVEQLKNDAIGGSDKHGD